MKKIIVYLKHSLNSFFLKIKNLDYFKRKEGFASYEIKVHSGTNKQLIVVFSGVGNVASGEVHFEWGNSLIKASDGDHIIFVKDNLRQWYTNPEGQSEIVAYIQAYIISQAITSSVAFGLSMGGYGALVFSSLMRFDYVVALSSRSCVGEKSAFDPRNKSLMSAIKNKKLGVMTPDLMNSKSQYVFIASLDQSNDLKHLALLKKTCPIGGFYLTRGDHNIGHEMNLQGSMQVFLQWVVDGCKSRPPAGINVASQRLIDLGEYLVKNKLDILSLSLFQEDFSDIPLSEIPVFLLDTHVQSLLGKNITPKAFPCPIHASINVHWLHHYLGLGWYQPDAEGCWSQGHWHQLKAQLIEPEIDKKKFQIRLQIQLYFPNKDKTPLFIEIFQNGQSVKCFSFGREQKNRMLVAPLVLDEDGFFDLMLYTPSATIPALQDPSGDSREIAMYLKSFVIVRV